MMSRLGTWTLLGADLADGIQLTLFTGSVRKPRNGQQKTDKQKWSAVRLAPRVNKPLRGTSPSWREKGKKKKKDKKRLWNAAGAKQTQSARTTLLDGTRRRVGDGGEDMARSVSSARNRHQGLLACPEKRHRQRHGAAVIGWTDASANLFPAGCARLPRDRVVQFTGASSCWCGGERVGVAQQGALLTGRYTGASFSYGHLKYKSLSANTVSRVLLQHV